MTETFSKPLSGPKKLILRLLARQIFNESVHTEDIVKKSGEKLHLSMIYPYLRELLKEGLISVKDEKVASGLSRYAIRINANGLDLLRNINRNETLSHNP